MSDTMNYFAELNAVNVSDKTEKKNGLTYLSWAYAWGELKKRDPEANATVYENKDGWNYHTDGRTCWVKVGVTAFGLEHIEYLPVMDFRNASIPADKVTSMDVNKAIQRGMTKAIARHGLGLYIYAGEDLPDGEEAPAAETAPKEVKPAPQANVEPQGPKMAARGQVLFIMSHCTEEELEKTQQLYGKEFEKMPYAIATKLISKLQERGA